MTHTILYQSLNHNTLLCLNSATCSYYYTIPEQTSL